MQDIKKFINAQHSPLNRCGGGQAAKARGCNPLIPGFKSQPPLLILFLDLNS